MPITVSIGTSAFGNPWRAEPELRHRQADERHHHDRLIGPAAVAHSRQKAGDHAHYNRKDERQRGQRQRHQQSLNDRRGDTAVEQDRSAEIAMQDAAVPGKHLQVERFVQSKLMAHLRELLWCCAGIEEHCSGIARHQPDHRERHQRNQRQHWHRDQQSPDDEVPHQRTASRVTPPAMSPTDAECDRARSS
jgi:hypothetical protein